MAGAISRVLFVGLLGFLGDGLHAAEARFSFGIVPQQSAVKLAQKWVPICSEISRHSGCRVEFKTAADITAFDKALKAGQFDIAYMNPHQFATYHQDVGYQAVAKEQDTRIRGVMVVARDSPYRTLADLAGKKVAFPSPTAFAASILTREAFRQADVDITPVYVMSHDSVYLTVAKGLYVAGGGVARTFNNMEPEVTERLRILARTEAYSPHAIAIHPRVPKSARARIVKALLSLDEAPAGRAALAALSVDGFAEADSAQWDDIRALDFLNTSSGGNE